MPRYLIERSFPEGLHIPVSNEGVAVLAGVVAANDALGVTGLHSYVSADRRKSFCLYDGPDPEAIRRAAERNGLPIEQITQVSVLDPYLYR